MPFGAARTACVATREGGVDRNFANRTVAGLMVMVATREGGVDRNHSPERKLLMQQVATREGGVDRNSPRSAQRRWMAPVATREGGVDRNTPRPVTLAEGQASPPARVAWIETIPRDDATASLPVATREGGVDRNLFVIFPPKKKGCRHPRGWRG